MAYHKTVTHLGTNRTGGRHPLESIKFTANMLSNQKYFSKKFRTTETTTTSTKMTENGQKDFI